MLLAEADRDRILATLMEEWSPLQRDLMDRLLRGEDDSADLAIAARHRTDACDLRRQRSQARARLREAMRARATEEW
ncbi:MAG TPA: hypothetical protein VFC86_04140 [Planctomycetota bacterium]|nr:hypothetical protein [Planctomycetota bacterium]